MSGPTQAIGQATNTLPDGGVNALSGLRAGEAGDVIT